jgi:Icc-related predicted phosphoesterase
MKIYVTSDIHLEFGDCMIKNEHNAEVLILGGDIMLAQDLHDHPEQNVRTAAMLETLGSRQLKAQQFRDFLKRCSFQFPHVIYIAGNHEFYHGKWPIGLQYLREECAKFPNVYFMENDCKTINDVTFIGATLWTDMNNGDPLTLHAVADMMNDFKIIRNSDLGFTTLRPAHVAQAHKKSVGYIRSVVAEQHDRKFVVVGHMAPSRMSTHEKYADQTLMNGAYSSSLDEFILDHPQIKLWTHGHTHEDFDYMIGSTRVVCNPRGYIDYEDRAENWKPMLVEI